MRCFENTVCAFRSGNERFDPRPFVSERYILNQEAIPATEGDSGAPVGADENLRSPFLLSSKFRPNLGCAFSPALSLPKEAHQDANLYRSTLSSDLTKGTCNVQVIDLATVGSIVSFQTQRGENREDEFEATTKEGER